ncbi:tetraacyldisaccharide 4'-kinase [Labrys monachus]|uniref:Tetraacyldisaccharide 4'-kinase n=1 Tax=Labrys monachus TaxID=217067 RepID=A0ABU0FAX6_9HYPH|nr:tetraacyldisaccharide 4'-kinase [Labrys monachus]MDQ0391591.1 tetraacyldisaccharide 4'-kinase [Labrys monachus]
MSPLLQPPRFWYRPAGWQARLLAPVAEVYGRRVVARMRQPGQRAAVPVVCIGNFTLGGAGKTPLALAVADLLAEAGYKPAFLTRGYGGSETGPLRVMPGAVAAEVGDEALLLARKAPTIVSVDRPAGAALAVSDGATIIVMDDGFQNPSLEKDCSIIAVDGETGIGNGMTFPAGPLRAPLHDQMPFVSAVVVIGPGDAGGRVLDFARGSGLAALQARIVLDPSAPVLRGKRVLAFAGIGRPEKFFKTLADMGAIIAATQVFPDHHPFTENDAMAIASRAQSGRLIPVTTTKDMVRLTGGPARTGLASITRSVPVRLVFEEENSMREFLHRHFRIRK